jgi:hypothetical protein
MDFSCPKMICVDYNGFESFIPYITFQSLIVEEMAGLQYNTRYEVSG